MDALSEPASALEARNLGADAIVRKPLRSPPLQAAVQRHVNLCADYSSIAEAVERALDFRLVLDLGCGSGWMLARLQEIHFGFWPDALASVPANIEQSVTLPETSPARCAWVSWMW